MGRVKGKVALVTGGASGLGKAMVTLLVQEGARVAVADVDRAGAERLAEPLNADGGQALAVALDVGSEAQWEDAMRRGAWRWWWRGRSPAKTSGRRPWSRCWPSAAS